MNAQDLMTLLDRLGIRPSRRLGQNFLVDPNLLDALVRDAAPRAGEEILEVGPGTGVLTSRLLAAGCTVTAIEIDHRLAAYLRETFGAHPAFRLREEDACRTDYAALFADRPFRCIANLPYACSSVFLAAMAALDNAPATMHVLLQREMAARTSAAPGSRDYGGLSVRLGLRYEASVLRRVPPRVFLPPPEVDSAFVLFRRRADDPPAALRALVGHLAAAVFAQRRKMLGKTLGEHLGDRAAAAAALTAAGIAPTSRPEQLSPADFARLAACLMRQ